MQFLIKGIILGTGSYFLFFLTFLYTLSVNPILDSGYFLDGNLKHEVLLSEILGSMGYLIATATIGAALFLLWCKALRTHKSIANSIGFVLVFSFWALLYSPAILLCSDSLFVDFVKYDQTFRDVATGTVLNLGRSYWALMRWGIVLELVYVPLGCLILIIKPTRGV